MEFKFFAADLSVKSQKTLYKQLSNYTAIK